MNILTSDDQIQAPEWCTHKELMDILNDTSWGDELLTTDLDVTIH